VLALALPRDRRQPAGGARSAPARARRVEAQLAQHRGQLVRVAGREHAQLLAVGEVVAHAGQPRGHHGEAHVHVLQELHRQQQLGEGVVQRGHHADVRALELARDEREGHGLARDVHAPRRQFAGERCEAVAVFAPAAHAQVHSGRILAQKAHGANQRLHSEARGEAAVIEHAQRPLDRPAHGWARRAEHALVGRVHDDRGPPRSHPAGVQAPARLLGDDDQVRGGGRADPLLPAHQARDRAVQATGELRLIQLGEGVVHVEHDGSAAQARQERRGHDRVGHVVRLHHVEAVAQVEQGEARERARDEVGVLAHVGARAADGLASLHGVSVNPARAHVHAPGVLTQAHEVNLVAALGQRARLALHARVQCEVGEVDHRHAQGAAAAHRATPEVALRGWRLGGPAVGAARWDAGAYRSFGAMPGQTAWAVLRLRGQGLGADRQPHGSRLLRMAEREDPAGR